jgi:hypothetical protein
MISSRLTRHGRNVNKSLVGNYERKNLSGRPSHRWENYIKVYLKEIDMRFWAGFHSGELSDC